MTWPAPGSASAAQTAPPRPAENSWTSVLPQTAQAVRLGWNPETLRSFSRNDSATAAGSIGPRLQRPEPREQQEHDAHVPLVFLGDAVDRLEHRLAGGEQREVVADRAMGGDDLGLGDRVERSSAPVEHQVHVGERLQARPEPAGGLADPLRHAPDLAGALGHDGDDLVGLAELRRPEDDALLLVGGHRRIVARREVAPPHTACDVSVARGAGAGPRKDRRRPSTPPCSESRPPSSR